MKIVIRNPPEKSMTIQGQAAPMGVIISSSVIFFFFNCKNFFFFKEVEMILDLVNQIQKLIPVPETPKEISPEISLKKSEIQPEKVEPQIFFLPVKIFFFPVVVSISLPHR